jgi:hypothetical protein
MPHLDINTPRGQLTLADEMAAVAIFHRHYPELRYIHTPKNDMSDIDGMVINHAEDALVCIAETKCRYDMTIEKFEVAYGRKWLVTFDKFVKGYKLADSCRVPFYGFLYIVPSKALLIKPLWTPQNKLEVDLKVQKTETQATVNGGRALRDNAYIDMAGVEPLFMTEVFHR